MRYVVLGIGRQGLAAVYDLVTHCQATEVCAVDIRFAESEYLAATRRQLRAMLGDAEQCIAYEHADFAGPAGFDALIPRLRGFDCILSALPYALNARVCELAIAASVPVCDMGGNPQMVEQQKTMAEAHGHVVVPECGLAPGLINVLMKHLRQHFECTAIRAYCGGLPAEKPDAQVNPLQYKLLFSPAGLISEYSGECPELRDGHLVLEPALSGLEQFDDDHEAFYTSNMSPRILEYLASLGVRDCFYKTLRYRGHLEKIHVLSSLGYFQGAACDAELGQRLADSAPLQFNRRRDRDKVMVTVVGSAGGAEVARIDLLDHLEPATGLTAMERTTSWGTTIVARALAGGIYRPRSFATPEQFIDPEWFIDELRRRTDTLQITQPST